MSKGFQIIEIYARVGGGYGYACAAECMERWLTDKQKREEFAEFLEELAVKCRAGDWPFRFIGKE